ncbi:MAG TPA: hypothetical protein VGG39_17110 [Polyangiaceae bacterium]
MRWASLPIAFLVAACSTSSASTSPGAACTSAGGRCIPGPTDAALDQDGSLTGDAPASTDATLTGPADAGLDAANTSGDADAGPTCVPQGGTYTCLGGSWPACPSTVEPSAACGADAQACMGCSEGAGFTCACSDAGSLQYEGGPDPYWFCVGTEYTCQ